VATEWGSDEGIVATIAKQPASRRSRQWPLSVLPSGQVAIRWAGSTELLRGDAIVLARSVGNYTRITTDASEYVVRIPLGIVVDQLEVFGMLRIHRAVAVNITYVRRVVGRGGHRLSLVLSTGLKVEVGRSYQREVRARLGARTQRGPTAGSPDVKGAGVPTNRR
jgi:DNA-binding LytR/AlgR family response regulator